jgi:hypothetical protein
MSASRLSIARPSTCGATRTSSTAVIMPLASTRSVISASMARVAMIAGGSAPVAGAGLGVVCAGEGKGRRCREKRHGKHQG